MHPPLFAMPIFRHLKDRLCIKQVGFLCVLSALPKQAERTIYEKA